MLITPNSEILEPKISIASTINSSTYLLLIITILVSISGLVVIVICV